MKKKTLGVLILSLFVIVFVIQNYEIVEINFLFWSFRASRILIIFFTLLIGFAIGWLIRRPRNKHE